MKKYVFGVDVGGTAIKMGFFTVKGELLEKWEIPTRTVDHSKNVLPDIAEQIDLKLKEKNCAKEEVAGIGFGVPGPVTKDGIVTMNANLGWKNKPVAKELSELTGLPCMGGNDVRTAGLGELWKGSASQYKNVFFITLGTGVGAAVIVEGKEILGSMGAAGEIGHIKVDDKETTPCACGGVGCIEQYASAPALKRMAIQLLTSSDAPSLLREREVDAKTVIEAYKKGDELAGNVVRKFAKSLGYGLACAAALIDPEVFIIGGGVSKAGQPLLDLIKEYYIKFAWPGCRDKKFILAALGNDAGIYGAASYILSAE